MRKLKYSHFKKKPIITYSDGSAFQWNQLRSCTGLSQRHSFRLRFCSRRFVNSRPPSVPHHKLQHNHINELSFLYLVFPHIRLLLFSSAAIASVLQYDTFPAFVPSPTRSTGAPPTRRVTASVVLADALHLAILTKTSTRAHCMKERKKDWSTTPSAPNYMRKAPSSHDISSLPFSREWTLKSQRLVEVELYFFFQWKHGFKHMNL